MISDPRDPGVRLDAEQAFAEAEAAALAASAEVDEAREMLALGRIRQGYLVKAQRRLAARLEDREQARAAVKAVDRAAQERHDLDAANREAERIIAARQLAVERDELATQLAAFLADVDVRAAGLNDAIAAWNARADGARKEGGGIQPGHLNTPSNHGLAWSRFTDGLSLLRRDFPAPRGR